MRKSAKWWNFVSKVFQVLVKSKIKNLAIVSLVFIYILAVLSYVFLVPSLGLYQVAGTYSVPWFYYPMLLGMSGLLGVVGLVFVLKERKLFLALSLILLFVLCTFAIGRTVSLVNTKFFTGFYESRFIVYLLFGFSIFASVALLKIKGYFSSVNQKKTHKIVISCFMVCLIVVSGASTTFLNVDYWYKFSNENQNNPTSSELNAVNYLSNIFDADPTAFVVTVTSKSQLFANLAIPAGYVYSPAPLYTAANPETALQYLYSPGFSHPYLYMNSRDFVFLKDNGYDNRYFAKHLLPMLPIVYENPEVTIYNMSGFATPESE